MKLELISGQLFVDGKEVMLIAFKDATTQTFPIESSETLIIHNSGGNSSATVLGNKNTTISGKNIVTGNITCKGDFRIGDG